MKKPGLNRLSWVLAAMLTLALAMPAAAAEKMSSGPMTKANFQKDRQSATELVQKATLAFKEMTADPAKAIPRDVISNAVGIAVLPGITKAALIAGGSRGHGVILARQSGDQWSNPLFVSLTGGSLGAQVGVQSTDLVLVFRTQESLDKLVKNQGFTLGEDASVAAGHVGSSASAMSDDSQVLAYSRSSGLFAGAALDGTVLRIESEPTVAYYGLNSDAQAHGYYGQGAGGLLYDRIIGSNKADRMGKSEEMSRMVPDSAKALKTAIDDYAAKAGK